MWELFNLFGKNQETINSLIRNMFQKNNLDQEIMQEIYNKIKGEQKMKNKEELLKRIEEEKQRAKDSLANVEQIEKQLKELEEKEVEVSATGVYSKTINEKDFWYLDFTNQVVESNFDNDEVDLDLIKINNCFVTKEQANQEALRREGQEFIRRCAMLWNKDHDWRTDMSLETEYMYYIGYGFRTKLSVRRSGSFHTVGTICFDTGELAERCIAELKAKYNEEQIKVIFGVK